MNINSLSKAIMDALCTTPDFAREIVLHSKADLARFAEPAQLDAPIPRNFAGIPIFIDPSIPPGHFEIRYSDRRELKRYENLHQ